MPWEEGVGVEPGPFATACQAAKGKSKNGYFKERMEDTSDTDPLKQTTRCK